MVFLPRFFFAHSQVVRAADSGLVALALAEEVVEPLTLAERHPGA